LADVEHPSWHERHPLLASRSFLSFFLADVFVTVAERYFVLTFAWWLLAKGEGSGEDLGILMFVEALPTLVLGILIGPVIDRVQKKKMLLLAIAAQAVAVSVLAVWLGQGTLSLFRLCVIGFVLGALLPMFEGTINAALPEVVRDDQLAGATAVQASTLEFSNIVAAALSATTLALFDFEVACWLNLGLFALGALFIAATPLPHVTASGPTESYVEDLKAGLGFLARQRALSAFVLVYVLKLMFTVPLLVIIPIIVDAARSGVGWVAVLETGFSVGSIATALWLGAHPLERRTYAIYALSLTALGGLMLLLSATGRVVWMLPNVVLMGVCIALLLSTAHLFFQRTVPNELKGRFFGILETLAAAVTPIGYALVGLTSRVGDAQSVLWWCGIGTAALGGVAILIPRVRQ
jgi:MFS transporter, DHA3 family, macrolide efflux protein